MHNKVRHLESETLLSMILERQRGWRKLLDELLQRHRGSLLSRCHARLQNRQDAEDAVQETELRVYRAIHGFRRDSSFCTWLFAIADRQCVDLARLRARHALSEHIRDSIEIHEQNLRYAPDVADDMARVRETLSNLSERERDILLLRFYLGLPLQDIAAQLGLGLSATKMRLYRAMESFARRFESGHHAL